MNLIVLVLGLIAVTSAAHTGHQCISDGDCPDGSFCEVTGMCESCLPCQILFNRENAGHVCAKSEDECGNCLPGFQAEDLTVQRRSFKCYPIHFDAMVDESPRSSIPWSSFTAIAASIVLLATLLLAFVSYYLKGRSLPSGEESQRSQKSEGEDRLPPPYDQVIGLARSSEEYAVVTLEEAVPNDATPFLCYSPYDISPENGLEGEDAGRISPSRVSTETIPSTWEPMDEDLSALPLERPFHSHRLVRSQSLDSLVVVPASVPVSRSVCDIMDGIYSHRHIRLSHYRRNNDLLEQSGCKIDTYEPLPPQSFLFLDTEGTGDRQRLLMRSLSAPEGDSQRHRGSQDSGFCQDSPPSASYSRRRPALNEELNFSVAVYAKRSRQE